MSKKQVTRELIIQTTVHLIDNSNELKDVNLREIARVIGCAHTNLYNYFDSLDDIIWEALGSVLKMMMENTGVNLSNKTTRREQFITILSNYIDFSMMHPGWYRLIWLNEMGGAPSDEIRAILSMPANKFVEAICELGNTQIPLEKAVTTADIVHGYLHGEVCKIINKRSTYADQQLEKDRIMSNLQILLDTLIK